MNAHLVLYLLMSLMLALWSANFLVAKMAMREFPPVLLGALRIGLAGLFLAPAYWRKARARRASPRGADLALLVFLAACNVGNQFLFLIGLNRTSVAHSSLILGTGPVFVLLLAASMGLERVTLRKITGMLVALAGVAMLVNQAPPTAKAGGGQATLAGDAVTAGACILFSTFTVFGKKATEKHGTVEVNGFAYGSGAVMLAPLMLWQGRQFAFASISPAGWGSLVYMALFPSVVCYLIYNYALSRISASRVSAFLYIEPVIATALAVAFLGERITTLLAAGGAVIVSGVYMAERG